MIAQPPASHWIAGAPFEDAAGRPLEVRYPATGEVIARLNEATFAAIEHAVAAAAQGFAVWSTTAPAARARVLRRAADLIRADARALAELETLDTGKPISETEVADWPSGADALEWFAALAATLSGEATDLGGGASSSTPAASRSASASASAPGTIPPRSPAGRPRPPSPAATR